MSGVLQNAVPVMKSGKSGRCLGTMCLNDLVRFSRIEATFRYPRGRQGFLALPVYVVHVVRRFGRQDGEVSIKVLMEGGFVW